ncbi:SixA phosphatase family protein [Falsirhodobacter sp. 20TX0035]|uniref:SixA phosphatase family protein n=1 Tax=Falsirhodobacter sp. 20TX0035 TaxID=3022019 RepID=UPI00232E126D|nr:histidine phosphatase family protein [Falsirhodobacter sp. 20TX0035]MDB6454665.1 histidine phosphatase family protein [Falsirhodobacter sp. 20TX0035]
MMRRLILIRHAKSDWDDPLLTDHQRVLARRGRDAAPKIGAWLAAQGVRPDEVLCSDATRTQDTWALIAPFLGDVAPTLIPALYHAGPDTILSQLRRATGQAVAIIGHNPGLGEFAGLMVQTRPAHDGFERFPTAAALVAELPVEDWSEAGYAMARPVAFTVPRDL